MDTGIVWDFVSPIGLTTLRQKKTKYDVKHKIQDCKTWISFINLYPLFVVRLWRKQIYTNWQVISHFGRKVRYSLRNEKRVWRDGFTTKRLNLRRLIKPQTNNDWNCGITTLRLTRFRLWQKTKRTFHLVSAVLLICGLKLHFENKKKRKKLSTNSKKDETRFELTRND